MWFCSMTPTTAWFRLENCLPPWEIDADDQVDWLEPSSVQDCHEFGIPHHCLHQQGTRKVYYIEKIYGLSSRLPETISPSDRCTTGTHVFSWNTDYARYRRERSVDPSRLIGRRARQVIEPRRSARLMLRTTVSKRRLPQLSTCVWMTSAMQAARRIAIQIRVATYRSPSEQGCWGLH